MVVMELPPPGWVHPGGSAPPQPTQGCSLATSSSVGHGPQDGTITRAPTETPAQGIHMDEAVPPFLLDAVAFPAALL